MAGHSVKIEGLGRGHGGGSSLSLEKSWHLAHCKACLWKEDRRADMAGGGKICLSLSSSVLSLSHLEKRRQWQALSLPVSLTL